MLYRLENFSPGWRVPVPFAPSGAAPDAPGRVTSGSSTNFSVKARKNGALSHTVRRPTGIRPLAFRQRRVRCA